MSKFALPFTLNMKDLKPYTPLYILLFLIMWHPYHGQETLYYNPSSSGTKVAEFYKINSDSSITYTRYSYANGKEEISEGMEKNIDAEVWKRFLKNGKIVSQLKTDTPEKFRAEMMHKTFMVERRGEKYPVMFYGNLMITDTPVISRYTRITYPRDGLVTGDVNYSKYELKEINGVYFLIYQWAIYLLENDKILHHLFPEANIQEAPSPAGNVAMASVLKVTVKDSLYGVSDNTGKTILLPGYEAVMICADAILAKKNNQWYFYDLFGKQMSKKGYRKILPLSIVDLNILVDKVQRKDGAALKYVVLEGKQVKIIDDIYKTSRNSRFVFNYGEMSICGTRTGSYTSQSINLLLNNNNIIIKERAYFQNYRFTDLDDVYNHFTIEKTQEIPMSSGVNSLKFFREEDAFTSYGFVNDQWIMLLKRVHQEKEYLYPVLFQRVTNPDYVFISKPYFEPEAMDKIEVKNTDHPLLVLEGDYIQYNIRYEDLNINNNFGTNHYYKLIKDGKYAFYSPLSRFVNTLNLKYSELGDLQNRFMRFTDEESNKKGWLSEDGEEFYD